MDKDDYDYQYDYENRIIKITADGNDIAEYAYDALGRRIKKVDSKAGETTVYYYNNNWQVLCDYNDSDVFQQSYAYGNCPQIALKTHHEKVKDRARIVNQRDNLNHCPRWN